MAIGTNHKEAVKADNSDGADLRASTLLGESLVSKDLITRKQLVDALKEQRDSGGRLGEVLKRMGFLSDDKVTQALAEYLSVDHVHFDDITKINMKVARMLPESIAKRFCLVAFDEEDDKIVVAMADPLNVIAIDTISLKLKHRVKVVISSGQEIKRVMDIIYHGSDVAEQELRDIVQLEDADDEEFYDGSIIDDTEDDDYAGAEKGAETAPVIRFVDLLLRQAVRSKASDIHIEPQEKTMSIRMRIDGILRDMVPPARRMQAAIITRIKILSDMDIAERRMPQDGRFKVRASKARIDVRVSTIPTIYGEKIVMRILDSSSANHDVDSLGFEPELLAEFKATLGQPHGIMIVTGPTGSGKSTTLYSALGYLKDPTKNITTVEDPVEYRMAGINQIQIKPDIDLDFAKCLRAILRQDPDIILIGEIRDKETVEIAIKASLTGHLVLSTFHTNDAPSAISRLMYMGVEPYLLSSALNLVVAQRLVRRICEKCKEPTELNEKVLARLKITQAQGQDLVFYHGKGCNSCGGTGYSGRLPIFEFLGMDTEMRQLIVHGASEAEIRALARTKGYGGLIQSGVSKIIAGLTTAEEVLSTTFTDDIKN
jgi:type IV pilus assembly protein PilB